MKLRPLAVLLLSGTAAAISAQNANQATKPDEDKKSAWDVRSEEHTSELQSPI